MNNAEQALKLLLLIVGIVSLPAIVAVFMPYSWLVRGVELAEPGTPVKVLVSYLARLLSAFYVLFGCMMVVFSTDVRRYAGAIRLVALWSLMAVIGFLIYGGPALVKGGLGWFVWFVAGDVAFGFAFAVAILLLQRQIAKQDRVNI
ncbi:MAG: hypothetical protein GWN67_27495 [Phycisphaerae bacterium]|nr:hypothetical protein [Phycisphaerae bacterium]NIP56053.1 hypothetical protein [Phycisphaerae bacterium]NIS50323.1 hypothetical protein [Phycisphaerae bacterium]NIU08070.1 hypothetical protein [Phycisphaerae bacterium]NIU59969.1 hypothetical protein [Phycisphaerae bacterium]